MLRLGGMALIDAWCTIFMSRVAIASSL